MEYRLLKLSEGDDYVQIFSESNSELLGSLLKSRHRLLANKYSLRLEDSTLEIRQGLLRRKRWTISPLSTLLKFKRFGKGIRYQKSDGEFTAVHFSRDKLTVSNESGRTAFIIDAGAFSSKDMVLLETYEKMDPLEVILCAVCVLDIYKKW